MPQFSGPLCPQTDDSNLSESEKSSATKSVDQDATLEGTLPKLQSRIGKKGEPTIEGDAKSEEIGSAFDPTLGRWGSLPIQSEAYATADLSQDLNLKPDDPFLGRIHGRGETRIAILETPLKFDVTELASQLSENYQTKKLPSGSIVVVDKATQFIMLGFAGVVDQGYLAVTSEIAPEEISWNLEQQAPQFHKVLKGALQDTSLALPELSGAQQEFFQSYRRATTQAEVSALYGQVRDEIQSAKELATRNGKSLLVLAGENHRSGGARTRHSRSPLPPASIVHTLRY